MRVDQIVLAEGVTNDLRGALTLVGISQRVFVYPVLPFRLLLRAAIMLTDETKDSDGHSFEELGKADISINVVDPSGNTTRTWSRPVELPSQKQWIDLPLQANVIADVAVEGKTYGIYLVKVIYSTSNQDEQITTIPLYVISPPAEIDPQAPNRAFPETTSVHSEANERV